MARQSVSGLLKEKLFERGYVLVDEIEQAGINNFASCAYSWKRAGLQIVNYPKGSYLNGECIKRGFYVWDDSKAPKVEAKLPSLEQARARKKKVAQAPIATTTFVECVAEEPQKPGKNKWEELKSRIVQQKFFLCCLGNKESATYKTLDWVYKVVEEIEFDERGEQE